MATRSDRLVPPAEVGVGVHTLATVPAGETWLVKSIRIVKDPADAPTVTMWLGAADANGLLFGPYQIAAGLLGVHDAGWEVAEAGDEITLEVAGAPVTVRVSGTRLPAGPS